MAYQWHGPAGIISGSTSAIYPAVDYSATGNYIFEVDPGNSCIVTDTVTVVVSGGDPLWTNPGPLCSNTAPVDLNAYVTGDVGGTWYCSETGVIIGSEFNPEALSGTYTVSYTVGSGGCLDSLLHDIVVNPAPDISISGDTTICKGESTVLIASGATNYVWSTGTTGNTITISPSVTTNYSLIGVASGCNTTISQLVVVNSYPEPQILGDTLVCDGDSVYLEAAYADSYLWNTGSTDTAIYVMPTSDTLIVLQGTISECTASDSLHVYVHDLPVAGISGPASVCEEAGFTLTATGGSSYLWVDGTTTVTYSSQGLIDSVYYVTVSDDYCSTVASHSLTVNPIPVLSISGDTSICKGESTVLVASGATNYVWSTGTTGNSITVSPEMNTFYSVA
ncbi:MAG: hypothetical protein C0594_02780 [Marinilabiliales bacterium]|nr:MAG: hypothetical protein C0594_02780 [Marinilabiliales bacterium]